MGDVQAAVLTDVPKPHIAVFIPGNLSGKPVPLRELREFLIKGISSMGVTVLDDVSMERFMLRHRIRYTGGIDIPTSTALKTEEKVDAVLITSVELYDDGGPPKIALISRLVSTGEGPKILWMESAALSGDDSPGILGLGLIYNTDKLREKVSRSILLSLERYFSGGQLGLKSAKKRYRPRFFYRSAELPSGKRPVVAVAPFMNVSSRRHGNEIVAYHFVEELVRDGGFDVIEPGVVRQKLLESRIVMSYGISLREADIITFGLDADLVVSGKVNYYQDYAGDIGAPAIDFSAVMIERTTRKVVWDSISFNRGDDGVFFFDRGKLNTAGALASQMVRNIVEKFSWR